MPKTQMRDFCRRPVGSRICGLRPDRAFALHDHLLTPTGAQISDGHLERLGGTTYAHVAPGTTLG